MGKERTCTTPTSKPAPSNSRVRMGGTVKEGSSADGNTMRLGTKDGPARHGYSCVSRVHSMAILPTVVC